jgi:hypothetical protein
MEAEPEMLGAAIAAPDGSTHGSSATTRSERLTWSGLAVEADPVRAGSVPPLDAEIPGEARAVSAAGRAAVGAIALLQLVWWGLLAYGGLQLLAL